MFKRPHLSIVVIFHDMQREAARTLYSMTRQYQNCSDSLRYEVIAIDNASSEPLEKRTVESLGSHFRYVYFDTESASPVEALNYGASLARGKMLGFGIDGARILSPGVFSSVDVLMNSVKAPFIYTLGFHLGDKVQNESISEGYNQTLEDELLQSVDWQADGYELFNISCLAKSSGTGFFAPLAESNFFCLPKKMFNDMGGFDTRFQTPGGGLANLDIFRRVTTQPESTPVVLLGEGTFHQFHGGVATNVEPEHHPMETYQQEYAQIHGHRWTLDDSLQPVYFGSVPPQARRFL